MRVVFILLILVYLNAEIKSRDLEVLNSGIMQLRKDDFLVVFYVTVRHHGEMPRNVIATMIECCEKIADEDADCEIIQMHGEHLKTLLPGSTRNITFLYPSVYGYNRKGSCTIGIWNRGDDNGGDESEEIRHIIDFDTTVRVGPEEVPVALQGLYNPEKIGRCETIDLDPFDGCNPVNCRLKYSGLRDHFNHKRKRCQKVPTCTGDPNKELPDIVYIPLSNTCRNLEDSVTESDIQNILSDKYVSLDKYDFLSKKVNIHCHQGEIDVRSGICVCDKGWTSEPFDPETYSKGIPVYHMCDKKCHPDVPSKQSVVPVMIGICLALWIFIMVVICECCNYFMFIFRRYDGSEEFVCSYQYNT